MTKAGASVATEEKWESIAHWPKGTCGGSDISTDSHESKEAAEAVCRLLERQGFGGSGKIFPIKTEVHLKTTVATEDAGRVHPLKTLPIFFDAIQCGSKTFEIRVNDRDFKVGDALRLQEYNGEGYTGREVLRKITYITDWAQKPNHVVMSVAPVAAAVRSGESVEDLGNETPEATSSVARTRTGNVLALGVQAKDETIRVLHVLCFNVPEMSKKQLAELSWKLDQFFSQGVAGGPLTLTSEGEGSRVSDPKEVSGEKEKEAAQKLCELYFNIAAEVVGEDEVRRRRDAMLPAAAAQADTPKFDYVSALSDARGQLAAISVELGLTNAKEPSASFEKIMSALRAQADTLTDTQRLDWLLNQGSNEGHHGWSVMLRYDNYQDGAQILNADGAVISDCYDLIIEEPPEDNPNAQFRRAIDAALRASQATPASTSPTSSTPSHPPQEDRAQTESPSRHQE